MLETEERYWECPKCGFAISFTLKGDNYVSFCAYCRDRLIITKEEYENEENDRTEYYFEFDK